MTAEVWLKTVGYLAIRDVNGVVWCDTKHDGLEDIT